VPDHGFTRARLCIACGEITQQPTGSRAPDPTCARPCVAGRWRLQQELHCGLCGGAGPDYARATWLLTQARPRRRRYRPRMTNGCQDTAP
jgi:hypothetical protein